MKGTPETNESIIQLKKEMVKHYVYLKLTILCLYGIIFLF